MPNSFYFCFLPHPDNRQVQQHSCKQKKNPKGNFFPEEINMKKTWSIVLTKPDKNVIPEIRLVLVERSPWPKPSRAGAISTGCSGLWPVSAGYLQGQRVHGVSAWRMFPWRPVRMTPVTACASCLFSSQCNCEKSLYPSSLPTPIRQLRTSVRSSFGLHLSGLNKAVSASPRPPLWPPQDLLQYDNGWLVQGSWKLRTLDYTDVIVRL